MFLSFARTLTMIIYRLETPVVPPTNNYNYQESRYKTELCRHWEETGTCPHGLQCLFAHGLFELRPFRGRHKKFKTQMCKAFHSTGFCSFGNRCSYIHEGRDVIPLLVQKFGFQVLHCLPADNESLLQFVLSRPELLSSDANKSPVSATRVQTIAAPQTGVQSQTRLSVFSKLCSH